MLSQKHFYPSLQDVPAEIRFLGRKIYLPCNKNISLTHTNIHIFYATNTHLQQAKKLSPMCQKCIFNAQKYIFTAPKKSLFFYQPWPYLSPSYPVQCHGRPSCSSVDDCQSCLKIYCIKFWHILLKSVQWCQSCLKIYHIIFKLTFIGLGFWLLSKLPVCLVLLI